MSSLSVVAAPDHGIRPALVMVNEAGRTGNGIYEVGGDDADAGLRDHRTRPRRLRHRLDLKPPGLPANSIEAGAIFSYRDERASPAQSYTVNIVAACSDPRLLALDIKIDILEVPNRTDFLREIPAEELLELFGNPRLWEDRAARHLSRLRTLDDLVREWGFPIATALNVHPADIDRWRNGAPVPRGRWKALADMARDRARKLDAIAERMDDLYGREQDGDEP